MITSRVTPPAEVKGAKVDGAEGVGGAADLDHLKRNCASLRLTVVLSMAHITWKWSDTGKGIEKWCKILVIVERKMSLSRIAISLCTLVTYSNTNIAQAHFFWSFKVIQCFRLCLVE